MANITIMSSRCCRASVFHASVIPDSKKVYVISKPERTMDETRHQLTTVGVPRKPSVAYYGGAFCFTTNAVFYLNMGRKTRRKLAAVQEDAGLKKLTHRRIERLVLLAKLLKEAYRAKQT
jgi:hypothetical protein